VALGRAGEQAAAAFLRDHGYEIEATNVRLARMELDIIARHERTLCFVEVRSRSSPGFGSAAETIGWTKRRHLARAATAYLQRRRPPWTGEIRFDVVAINPDPATGQTHIELIPGAFTVDG
jgi:putative endonuclease